MSSAVRRVCSVGGLVAVAVPASVAAHCAGYELAAVGQRWLGPLGGEVATAHANHGHHASDVHGGHLPLIPLSAGALLLGAIAVLAALVGGRRVAGVGAPRLSVLVTAQLTVLVAIESAGLVSGMSAPVASVLLAVALQVPVALVAVVLTRGARRLLARLLGTSASPLRSRPLPVLAPVRVTARRSQLWSMRPPGRAPPVGWPSPIPAPVLATL